MQEGQAEGRRSIYIEGGVGISPANVSSQAISTMEAKNRKINIDLAKAREKIDTIQNTITQTYGLGRDIKTSQDKDAISSMKLKNANAELDYTNSTRNGGTIDAMNISNAEKLKLKEQAGAMLKVKLEANKNVLAEAKGFFSKVLGTEDLLNQTINEAQLNADKIASDVDAKTISAYKEYNKEESKRTLQEMILTMSQSNTESGVYSGRDEVAKNIDYAISNGILTENEGMKAKFDVFSEADIRANQVFLNNVEDLALKGKYQEAYNLTANRYNATRENRVYQNSNKRVEIETSLRNALIGLARDTNANNRNGEIYSSGLSYNITGEEATQNLPDDAKQKVLQTLSKRNSKTMGDFTSKMLEWKIQNNQINGNVDITDPLVIADYQERNGVGYASALTNAKANVFKGDYGSIGTLKSTNVNGELKPLTGAEEFKRFIVNNENNLGGLDNVVKEAKYHLPTEAYVILNAINNGVNIETLEKEINLVVLAKNKGEFGIKDDAKLDNNAISDFKKSSRGTYLQGTGQLEQLNKEAKAYRMIAEATKSSVNNVADKMDGNTSYIAKNKMFIEIDKSKYNVGEIEGSINTIFANPEKYLGIKNEFGTDLSFIKVETSKKEELSFYAINDNGTKQAIKKYRFDDLPKSNEAGEKRLLELQKIENEKNKNSTSLELAKSINPIEIINKIGNTGKQIKNAKEPTNAEQGNDLKSKVENASNLLDARKTNRNKEKEQSQKSIVDRALKGENITAEELGSLSKLNYNLIKNINKAS